MKSERWEPPAQLGFTSAFTSPNVHWPSAVHLAMSLSEYYGEIRRKVGQSLILVPGVAAIVRDGRGRILFQRKPDGTWSLPAGAIEPGENPAQAIVREVLEETGLQINPERLVGIFGGLGFRYRYPNGDEVEYTVVLFECSAENPLAGFTNDETDRLEYFAPEEIPALELPYPIQIFSNLTGRDVYFEPA